jgi:hypothetical protein
MRELTDTEKEAGRKFHADMQRILGLSDEDYVEFKQIMARRLAGERHVHTRFCGHEAVEGEGNP